MYINTCAYILKTECTTDSPKKTGKRTFAQFSDLNSGTVHYEVFGCFVGRNCPMVKKKVAEKIPSTNITTAAPLRHILQISGTLWHGPPKPPETLNANDIYSGERTIHQTTEVLLNLQF